MFEGIFSVASDLHSFSGWFSLLSVAQVHDRSPQCPNEVLMPFWHFLLDVEDLCS